MPHNRKHAMRNAMVVTTALSTVVLGGVPAVAQPPGSASDAAKRLRELSRQAEVLTEDVKKSQDDHDARQRDLGESTAAAHRADVIAERARGEEERFRGRVDELSAASYRGARLNTLSTLLTSDSPGSFLERATAVEALAKENNEAVRALATAANQAEFAQQRGTDERVHAARAEADAARLQHDISARKEAMDAQIAQVKQQYSKLSAAEQEELSGGGTDIGPITGNGVAIAAVNAALGKQNSPYVWGAKGPDEFDCSGLVQWSYQQAGKSLPGSTRSQVSTGTSVSEDQLRPGDVIFFYSSASHNGIYLGGGKIVHAPTEGQDVKVENYKYVGDIHSIRRMTG